MALQIDWKLFLSPLALVFVAELPDKTAFATLLLAIFIGVAMDAYRSEGTTTSSSQLRNMMLSAQCRSQGSTLHRLTRRPIAIRCCPGKENTRLAVGGNMNRASDSLSHRGCFDNVVHGRELGEKQRTFGIGNEKFFPLIVFNRDLGAAEITSIFQCKTESQV